MKNRGDGTNPVQSVALDKLERHPDNPNEQSRGNFAKLVRNIEKTGRYEPLIVRPSPGKKDSFQIINGHHRHRALSKLGHKEVSCIVWDVDDEQTDILLATLNRLGGTDKLSRKVKLLGRLNKRLNSTELAKLLPMRRQQIERLANLKMPSTPPKVGAKAFANPMVFFLDDHQQQTVENALSMAAQNSREKTRAARNAAALTEMAMDYLQTPGPAGQAEGT